MEYSSEVLRRVSSPGFIGTCAGLRGTVVRGTAEDRSLNAWLGIEVEVADAVVVAVRYQAYGCPHFLAAVDWIAERLEGQPIDALESEQAQAAAVALMVPREKLGKLLVIEDALAASATMARST